MLANDDVDTVAETLEGVGLGIADQRRQVTRRSIGTAHKVPQLLDRRIVFPAIDTRPVEWPRHTAVGILG